MTLIRGFRTELESLVGDGKGKGTSGSTMRPKVPMRQPESHCSIVAKKRSNVRGAKGAGHPRQGGVNGKPEELLVLAEAGRLPWGGTSRMNREIHVRICGRLGVKFPGPTRRDPSEPWWPYSGTKLETADTAKESLQPLGLLYSELRMPVSCTRDLRLSVRGMRKHFLTSVPQSNSARRDGSCSPVE